MALLWDSTKLLLKLAFLIADDDFRSWLNLAKIAELGAILAARHVLMERRRMAEALIRRLVEQLGVLNVFVAACLLVVDLNGLAAVLQIVQAL